MAIDPFTLLENFLSSKKHLVILSGAGISVSSGIPTYRDIKGNWQRSQPIQHRDFILHKATRQKYWARSYAGWPSIEDAEPTLSHYAITSLEKLGKVGLVVTQNVDRLHQKSGTKNVIDLHGRLDKVVCIDCRANYKRNWVQKQLEGDNSFLSQDGLPAPDGDTEIENEQTSLLILPRCSSCPGILKPEVVFFGDQVDKNIVKRVYEQLDLADGLLIIGTSLQLFSGYRFCRYAAKINLPIATINPGKVRGEELISTIIRSEADKAFGSINY